MSWVGQAPGDECRVMHIEWDGDVHERRGIQTLFLRSLEKSLEGPEWKDIVLG